MMNFGYYMPTRLVLGRNCVTEHAALFAPLGKHALIVTGKSSAFNGALNDVLSALNANGQAATVFDRVTPNPGIPCIREGIALLKSAGADFVVAIGGGSPMDAGKAIALLAVQERADSEIFAGNYAPEALPMAHIPTTAGTGSEVTPYSILTNDVRQTKTSISSPALFPRVAFLDGKYMAQLAPQVSLNTALDALSHAVESMLSRNAIPMSNMFSEEAIELIVPLLGKAQNGRMTLEERDTLLYASTLAGMAIAQSGTTAVHGMGYALTYFHDIPHGRANALLLGETLRLCEEKKVRALPHILAAFRAPLDGVTSLLDALVGKREEIGKEELEAYAARAMMNKNIKKSVYEPTFDEVRRIYFQSFGYDADEE